MGLIRLPPELVYDIVDRLSPSSWEWSEHHSQIKWLLGLRLVSKYFDSIVISWFLATIKANPDFDGVPLMLGVPTPSTAQMCNRLLTEEVNRDQSGSKYSLVRTITWGADVAVELLRDHHSDIALLRNCYVRGLISNVVGLLRPYTPLAHLAGKDGVLNEEFEPDDRQSVALVAAAGLGRISDMGHLVKLGADIKFDKQNGWLASPCHAASLGGHLDVLEFLIDQGLDLNAKGLGNGDMALHYAAAAGHDRVVRFLLDNQADVDTRNSDKETPLLCAAAAGHSGTTKLLLDHSADVNAQDLTGKTPLLWAAWRGHISVMETLLGRDEINIECTDSEAGNMTAIAVAALSGREEVVNILLAQPNINLHAKDDGNYTILKHAVEGGNEAIVKTILNLPDTQVNWVGDEGTTPLMWAARAGNETLVRLLLSHNEMEVNIKAEQGLTALTFAVTSENQNAVRALLEREDIDINAQHDDSDEMEGKSLLGLLAASGHEEMARLLLEHPDIKPDFTDMFGSTPLAAAATHDHPCIIKLLLARDDVDVNATDHVGYTALMHAVENGNEAAARALLQEPGILVRMTNHTEETALELAVSEGHVDSVRVLVESNMGFTRNDIESALRCSSSYGHKDVQAYLSNQLVLIE